MDKREQMIRLWFSMWLEKKDLGMDDIFAENVVYTESWGPCYSNRETVKHWFQEWNMRGSVIAWEIQALKEFGCNIHNYDPYQKSDTPQFREEKIHWF